MIVTVKDVKCLLLFSSEWLSSLSLILIYSLLKMILSLGVSCGRTVYVWFISPSGKYIKTDSNPHETHWHDAPFISRLYISWTPPLLFTSLESKENFQSWSFISQVLTKLWREIINKRCNTLMILYNCRGFWGCWVISFTG